MKLSIITINYNHIKGLRQTIESVVSQCCQDFEYIIIDGGSTDGSRELIEQYQEHLSYWCSEPDKGVYNAMNKGIVQAHGDYLLFLNSGDYLCDKDALSKVFSQEHKSDLLVGYIYRHREKGLYIDKGFDTSDITIRHLLRNSLPHQATFIRRELFDKYGLYDETLKVVADWKFFAQCIILHNVSIENLLIPITVYEEGGISDHPENGGTEEWNRSLEEILPKRVICDLHYLRSCEDVVSVPLPRFLFRLLYRLTMFIKY